MYITLQTKYVDFDEEAEEILLGIEWFVFFMRFVNRG